MALREQDGDPQPVRILTFFEIVAGPEGYVTGEETALIHHLERGVAKPTFVPPRPYERGLHGRPTLVQNPETLAHVALIARYGSEWFRRLGSPADPGSVLLTISGAVAAPGSMSSRSASLCPTC